MAAKVRLLDTHPYLARALFAISTHPLPGLGTLAVDNRWRLAYDPDILDAWSVPEIAGVLYHEVLHLLRDHAGRSGSRVPEAWNAACDAEINDDLRPLIDQSKKAYARVRPYTLDKRVQPCV